MRRSRETFTQHLEKNVRTACMNLVNVDNLSAGGVKIQLTSLDLCENQTTQAGINVFPSSSSPPTPPPASFLCSGMFFDGNHTYTIEPGGQDSDHVSVHEVVT